MRILLKKILISLVVSFLTIGTISTATVNAYSEVSQMFREFMDECFDDKKNVTVYIKDTDVTEEFFNKYSDMYNKGELLTISNDVEYYGYSITHEISEPTIRVNTIQSKTFKSYETATVNGNKKEWITLLYCKFTYNADTGNIISIANPQLNVDFGSWGSAFSPRYINVSTGKEKISRLSVKYTCEYDVEATFDPPYLPASTWSFGNVSRSYTLEADL